MKLSGAGNDNAILKKASQTSWVFNELVADIQGPKADGNRQAIEHR